MDEEFWWEGVGHAGNRDRGVCAYRDVGCRGGKGESLILRWEWAERYMEVPFRFLGHQGDELTEPIRLETVENWEPTLPSFRDLTRPANMRHLLVTRRSASSTMLALILPSTSHPVTNVVRSKILSNGVRG